MSNQKPLRRSNIFYHQRNLRNLSCPLYNLHLPHRTQPHIYARALCMPQSRPGFLVLHMDANATNRVHNILTLSAIMMDTTETGTTRKISTGRPVRYTFCPCRRFVPLCNHHGIVNVSFFFAEAAYHKTLLVRTIHRIRRHVHRARIPAKLSSTTSAKAVADNDVDNVGIRLVVSSGTKIRACKKDCYCLS